MNTYKDRKNGTLRLVHPFTLTLEDQDGPTAHIIFLPGATETGQHVAPFRGPHAPQEEFDDDMANATWEDAEWR